MTRFDKYRYHGFRTTRVRVEEGEAVTRQGLAYTPAQMAKLTEKGLPVTSAEIAAQFYDGDEGSDFFVTSDREKGKDINDLWEEDKDTHEKFKKAAEESKKFKKDE